MSDDSDQDTLVPSMTENGDTGRMQEVKFVQNPPIGIAHRYTEPNYATSSQSTTLDFSQSSLLSSTLVENSVLRNRLDEMEKKMSDQRNEYEYKTKRLEAELRVAKNTIEQMRRVSEQHKAQLKHCTSLKEKAPKHQAIPLSNSIEESGDLRGRITELERTLESRNEERRNLIMDNAVLEEVLENLNRQLIDLIKTQFRHTPRDQELYDEKRSPIVWVIYSPRCPYSKLLWKVYRPPIPNTASGSW
ncbi:unnamed protein product [Calicophoron daubneyi]|uniref:Uncharacterized protein n=1 Tax=Calicophoron daubneyi TaxID=300641 RepID=A0AAV2SZK2_CALDB